MKQEHKILCSVGLGESCEPLGNLHDEIEKGKLFTSLTSLPPSSSLSEPVAVPETFCFHKMERLIDPGQELPIYYRLHVHKPYQNSSQVNSWWYFLSLYLEEQEIGKRWGEKIYIYT